MVLLTLSNICLVSDNRRNKSQLWVLFHIWWMGRDCIIAAVHLSIHPISDKIVLTFYGTWSWPSVDPHPFLWSSIYGHWKIISINIICSLKIKSKLPINRLSKVLENIDIRHLVIKLERLNIRFMQSFSQRVQMSILKHPHVGDKVRKCLISMIDLPLQFENTRNVEQTIFRSLDQFTFALI